MGHPPRTPPRSVVKARCTVCRHPRRAEIELAHVSGVSAKAIGDKFGLGHMSVFRHCANHLTDEMRAFYCAEVDVRELAARAHAESMSLMDYVALVRATLMRQLQIAAGANDRHATAALSGKLIEALKLNANLTGELSRLVPSSTTNIAIFAASPEFAQLQAMLVRALAGHPDALERVLSGLQDLEARAAPPTMIDGKAVEHATAA